MTRKRDKFLRDVAQLISDHSAEDWEYVADHLEDVARLARTLSLEARALPPAKRKGKRRSTARIRPKEEPASRTPLVADFARYLDARPGAATVGKLRDLAILLGAKEELPRTRALILQIILQNIEKSDPDVRIRKVKTAITFLEREEINQSDHYDRWVSLITKNVG